MSNLYETKCSQVEGELVPFMEVLRRENVTRFLEVGSRYGGSLWRIAKSLPKGSRVVSCDSAKGMGGQKAGALDSLRACVDRLRKEGYDAHFVKGHSQAESVIWAVQKLGPFDAVFIDGDHTYDGVKADWKNFGKSARIVAFHDIAWEKPENYSLDKLVEVPRLWNEIKDSHRHEEFVDKSDGRTYGIGVLWRS